MSLFDLKLPTASGNLLGDLTTKLQEGANKVVTSFGGTGPFQKVAAVAPSLDQSAAETSRLLRQAQTNAPDQSVAETERLLRQSTATVEGSKTYNAMSYSAAKDSEAASEDAAVSAESQNAAIGNSQSDDHLVKLVQVGTNITVKFIVMPEVAESRSIKYQPVAPPQSPAAFQKYEGTDSVQWSLNATLTSRTTDEATENLRIINQLRGWTMPYFGERTLRDYPDKLGAPPPVLTFSGYRNQMIGPVPVVITSLNWQFTPDCDYIPAYEFAWANPTDNSLSKTGKLIPFPTVIKVAIQLVETFSTDQFNGFSYADFRIGQFKKAWASLPGAGTSTQRDGRDASGGAAPAEPAQTTLPNSLRGGNGYFGPGAGRGDLGGPTAAELEAYRNQIPVADYSNEGRNYGVAITERIGKVPFKSGGGGDFGGGGASGTF